MNAISYPLLASGGSASPLRAALSLWALATCLAAAAQSPTAAPTGKADELAVGGRGLMTLNFQNIDIRSLLQVMADFTGLNLVVSDSVTGAVTLHLKDVPWTQALDIILQAKGLGMRKSGNVLWIAPKDELAAKEQIDLESKKKVTELEPLDASKFPINTVFKST